MLPSSVLHFDAFLRQEFVIDVVIVMERGQHLLEFGVGFLGGDRGQCGLEHEMRAPMSVSISHLRLKMFQLFLTVTTSRNYCYCCPYCVFVVVRDFTARSQKLE